MTDPTVPKPDRTVTPEMIQKHLESLKETRTREEAEQIADEKTNEKTT